MKKIKLNKNQIDKLSKAIIVIIKAETLDEKQKINEIKSQINKESQPPTTAELLYTIEMFENEIKNFIIK